MKVGSLFSGIGGFDLGLERAGMRVVWQSEIEPYCCRVLNKWWPDVPNLGDIFKIKNPPSVDLICGGFPCQPFSVAGKRKGKADDRYLWPEMLRVIKEVRPRWVFAENVLGIIAMELDQVLSDLESAGYDTGTLIIPACALNAPHRRDRVWIVAHNGLRQSVELSGGQRTCGDGTDKQDQIVADPQDPNGWPLSGQNKQGRRTPEAGRSDRHTPDTDGQRLQRYRQSSKCTGKLVTGSPSWQIPWPEVAACLCRVDDGLPAWVHRHRVKRLKALGNAIVPQIAEVIGRMIMKIEQALEGRKEEA